MKKDTIAYMYKITPKEAFKNMMSAIDIYNNKIDYIEISLEMFNYLLTVEPFVRFKIENLNNFYGVKIITNEEMKDSYCRIFIKEENYEQ